MTVQQPLQTYASIAPNKGQYKGSKKTAALVDIPGHEKMKPSLPQHLAAAACVVYLIDSSTFMSNSTREAQALYDILVESNVYEKKIPMLIFCNKTDLDSSIAESDIQSTLERELDDLRITKGSAPTELGRDDGNHGDIYLGNEGETFQFDHLPNEVTFAKGSLLDEELPESIISFIESCQ
eukprot:gene1178-1355_t